MQAEIWAFEKLLFPELYLEKDIQRAIAGKTGTEII